MNDAQKDMYLAWLKDAHAMELALVTALEKQISDAEGKPTIQEHLQEHLEETRAHAEKVEACITRNGGDTSTAKDLMGKITATMNGLTMSMMHDLHVKNIHSAYAAEHVEITSYTTIRAAAQELGDIETVAVCDDILEDEFAMAAWVQDQIPLVVTEHIRDMRE